jgi:hypothetical protein
MVVIWASQQILADLPPMVHPLQAGGNARFPPHQAPEATTGVTTSVELWGINAA